MRAGFGQFSQPSQEFLRFCAQFGATDVLLNSANLPGTGGRWQLHDLVKLRLTVEQYGLSLSALENVPISFYDHIMLGGLRRDEQIENMIATVRNIARAGIPIFGYHWMPSMVWRTTPSHIRCGAVATAFDYDEAREMPLTHDREYTEQEMWNNLEHWIRIITPIAEEEGIRLGIHPWTRLSPCWEAFLSYSAASTPTSGSSRYTRQTPTASSSARAPSPRWRARTSTR